MNNFQLIKLLLQRPLAVLRSGLIAEQEFSYRNSMLRDYSIDRLPTVDLMELFPGFEEELSTYSFLEGTSLVSDIMLLKKLAKGFSSCNYLEIGSWRGESIINISEVSDKCTSLTLSPEEMKSMNISNDFIHVHGAFSKQAKNITEILHNSHTFDFGKLGQTFDLIFIDGDHSYKGVLNDTQKTFNLRKDATSIIVWHDYGFSTETVRHSVLKAILDGIPSDKHRNLYHVSNTMCAVYMENKNFKTYHTKFPIYPNKKFNVKVRAEKI